MLSYSKIAQFSTFQPSTFPGEGHYVAEPRGGAIRNYLSEPKAAVEEEPENFDPEYGYENDLEVNKYKSLTDTALYAILFFLAFKFINKLKKQ